MHRFLEKHSCIVALQPFHSCVFRWKHNQVITEALNWTQTSTRFEKKLVQYIKTVSDTSATPVLLCPTDPRSPIKRLERKRDSLNAFLVPPSLCPGLTYSILLCTFPHTVRVHRWLLTRKRGVAYRTTQSGSYGGPPRERMAGRGVGLRRQGP